MTHPRAALSRQDLPKLLGLLRAQSVKTAQFHPDGRLAAVEFGSVDDPGPDTKPTQREPDRFQPQRAAWQVLQGGSKDMDGDDLEVSS